MVRDELAARERELENRNNEIAIAAGQSHHVTSIACYIHLACTINIGMSYRVISCRVMSYDIIS